MTQDGMNIFLKMCVKMFASEICIVENNLFFLYYHDIFARVHLMKGHVAGLWCYHFTVLLTFSILQRKQLNVRSTFMCGFQKDSQTLPSVTLNTKTDIVTNPLALFLQYLPMQM